MSDDLGVVPAAAAEGAEGGVEVTTDSPEGAPQPEGGTATETPPVAAPEPAKEEASAAEVSEHVALEIDAPLPPETESVPVLETPHDAPPEPAREDLSEPPQASQPASPVPAISGAVGLAARRAKRAARVQRIFELKKLERPITNNDVQLLLRVSHVTATTYLNELVVAGRLFVEGRGRGRIYRFL